MFHDMMTRRMVATQSVSPGIALSANSSIFRFRSKDTFSQSQNHCDTYTHALFLCLAAIFSKRHVSELRRNLESCLIFLIHIELSSDLFQVNRNNSVAIPTSFFRYKPVLYPDDSEPVEDETLAGLVS